MSDKHAENKKLFALGKAIYGDDEKKYWQYINTRVPSDTWGGTGYPPRWIGDCEYRRKADAPKLPDGDCSSCDWNYSQDNPICETCEAVNPRRNPTKQPEPTKGWVLCCDCVSLNLDDSNCPDIPAYIEDTKIQGCTEGTPKPKMLSINGYEFPEPIRGGLSEGDNYFLCHPSYGKVDIMLWVETEVCHRFLDNGLIQRTKQGAEQQLAAILAACRGEVKR
jgi:hypothetical protein